MFPFEINIFTFHLKNQAGLYHKEKNYLKNQCDIKLLIIQY